MLILYKILTRLSAPILHVILQRRLKIGKEERTRLAERQGKAAIARPDAPLIWIHAASVGEAQSALILIKNISDTSPHIYFLVTTGTRTSAALMAKRLPTNAVHQYYPLDHPEWVTRFVDHWHPDLTLWMESELWPNMLGALKTKQIPTILINARLSDKSYKGWRLFKCSAGKILSAFALIMAQSEKDAARYRDLSDVKVVVTDNLKHSATPLPHDAADFDALNDVLKARPLWLYASTHDGEEELAAQIHTNIKAAYPDLLTIIVPRHPERRDDIAQKLNTFDLEVTFRGDNKNLPTAQTDIYIADTLGELGLFYRLSDIAVIGRSFSRDGGGGHNPIEAAQLDCAVLTGENVQYQQQLFDEMLAANAAFQATNKAALEAQIKTLLSDASARNALIQNAKNYAGAKDNIIHDVMKNLTPYLQMLQKAER